MSKGTSTWLWRRRTKHGAPFDSRDLEGERSPGRTGSRHAGNGMSLPRTSRRSKALEPTGATGASGSGELATANRTGERAGPTQRQEGNGHGDVVRLSRGNILRGVEAHVAGSSRTAPVVPSGATGPTEAKRGEPQDRQRDATSPRTGSGGSRRGGVKPRGRNGIDEDGSSSTEARRASSRGSGRSRVCRWRGEGAHAGHVIRGRGRIPGETVGEIRPGRALSSEGERRQGGLHHSRKAVGAGARASKVGRVTGNHPGGVRGRPTTRERAPRGATPFIARWTWLHGPRRHRQPHESCQIVLTEE
jgi:hypothetical protein